jgi:hypothetical protein
MGTPKDTVSETMATKGSVSIFLVRTWLFGEAEYESTETYEENFKRLWKCGEDCGYMTYQKNYRNGYHAILMDGGDEEHVRLLFNNKFEITKIEKDHFIKEELKILV